MHVCSLLSLFWVRGGGEEPQCQPLISELVTTSQLQGEVDSSVPHPNPPQASLAADEGVRGLSRNGKVAQHCSAFRLLSHSLDPLPVPGFSGTFQATSSAHLCFGLLALPASCRVSTVHVGSFCLCSPPSLHPVCGQLASPSLCPEIGPNPHPHLLLFLFTNISCLGWWHFPCCGISRV